MKLGNVISEGVYDPGIFKAIFLAGGPGSGKSFVSGEIVGIPKGGFSGIDMSFAPNGAKLVNSDPEFEYFLKKAGIDPSTLGDMSDEEFESVTVGADSPRGNSKRVKSAKETLYVQGRLGLLIDGTGDDYAKIKKKKIKLNKLGYDCYMIFINTTLEVAQYRNAHRPRVLPVDVVEDIWGAVQSNLGKFQSLFKSNFRIIDNTEKIVQQKGKRLFPQSLYTTITRFMNTPIKSSIAKKWVNNELAMKNRLKEAFNLKAVLEGCGKKHDEDMVEDAPPGKNYDRMIKILQKKFGKDSDVPFQIAWSKYNARDKK
tara:strand:+ start:1006 stop:1944 length:939 start_codon:yes stop_codon:yes gene_type:complete